MLCPVTSCTAAEKLANECVTPGRLSVLSEKPTASEVGITADEIRIAVIADVENPLAPGLFQGSVEGVEGWAKYVNKHGGLAGRTPEYLPESFDFRNGKMYPNARPGLGVTADMKQLTMIGEVTQPGRRNVYRRPDGSLTHW